MLISQDGGRVLKLSINLIYTCFGFDMLLQKHFKYGTAQFLVKLCNVLHYTLHKLLLFSAV